MKMLAWVIVVAGFVITPDMPNAADADQTSTYRDVKRHYEPNRIVCKRIQRRRSFTKVRICATQREWDEERQNALGEMQERADRYTFRPIGYGGNL